jgi:hypothetical protein
MLIINNSALAKTAEEELGLLEAESKWQELRHSFVCWARSVSYHRGVYGALLSSVLAGRRDAEAGERQSRELRVQNQGLAAARIRLVDQVLIAERVRDFELSLPALARNSSRIRESIAETALATPEEPSYGKWNHFMVPVRYESNTRREAGRQFLLSKRVDTSPLYQNCVRNARKYAYRGGCPQAELAAQTVCTVPNHAWLSDDEVGHICGVLRLSAEIK